MPKKKTTSVKKKAVKKAAKKTVKKVAKKATGKSAKKVAKKAVKKAVKKAASRKAAAKKTTAKKKTAKKTASRKSVKTKAIKKKAAVKIPVSGNTTAAAPQKAVAGKKDSADDGKNTPIVFSLDDIEELMASKKPETEAPKKAVKKAAKQVAPKLPKKVEVKDEPVKQRVLGAASLADILGFNPAEKKKGTDLSSGEVPKKWQKYYKLLIDLRKHVSEEIDLHTSDTLKHTSRDDSGDLSGYGTHQADAGSDTFDRDFALSLVSGEQEALNEIEEAIQRIKNGTYGVCEVTGKAIPAARLTAVPFARYSVEGQAEYEKNRRRKVDRSGSTGLFGDTSDVPKIVSSDDDE